MISNELKSFPNFLAEIFLLANNYYNDFKTFVNSFMLSDNFKNVLSNYGNSYLNPYKEFFKYSSDIKKIGKTPDLSNNIALYIGHIYGYFILISGESAYKILKTLPVDKIINNYDLYHTLSEEKVIFISKYEYNLKMNPIRKMRSKSNPIFKFDRNEYNVFIASQIYQKLFYYEELNKLEYKFNDFPYLINKKTLIVTETINNLKDIYKKIHTNKYDYLKYERENNIMFLFINQRVNINEDLKDVLINKYNGSIPFDMIFIFDNHKIIFSNIETPTQIFYLDINNIDIKEINNKYQNRFILI